jgi:hypothetical protein
MRGVMFIVALGVAALALASQGRANANYGSFSAPFFTYVNVSETDSETPPFNPLYLFGTPMLSGNALSFASTGFSVGSSGNGGEESQDGQLSFNLVGASSSIGLADLEISEGGNWEIILGGPSTSASAAINVTGVYVTAINGSTLPSPILVPAVSSATFGTNTGLASTNTGSNSVTFSSLLEGVSDGTWSIATSFPIATDLQNDGISGVATSLSVTLDDVLTAYTDKGGATAQIDKPYFNLVGTPTSPEPTSLGLLVGAGLLAARRRRA